MQVRAALRARDTRLVVFPSYAISAIGSEVTVLAIPIAAAILLGRRPLQMGLLTAAGTAPYVGSRWSSAPGSTGCGDAGR